MKLLLALALLLAAAPGWAAVYKWVDQDGKVHYSDQPPPETAKKQDVLKARRAPSTPPAPPAAEEGDKAAAKGPKTPAEQEMEFRKRRLEAAEAEAKRQQEAQANEEKKRNCAQARSRLTALETGGRVTRYGPNGEQLYLSDDEMARELGEARRVADSWCK